MTDIDTLSGAELDALAATRHMGWHQNGRYWMTEKEWPAGTVGDWHPSSGHDLNPAASDVLLKALGDALYVEVWQYDEDSFCAVVKNLAKETAWGSIAPTLPLALVRAICKAVAK